ncbi:Soluble cytochrome b562 precursor [Leminorella richardii]|uniref:Soluble cytochrome b562 n=1 Tax=Leminorella richardii TaxID=158841 RepID=A0A2X4UVU8_9GAMM|nr:cytochrome b562 [Leminorella richardii]SQI42539.1 Soluble cytochrome b562 precursor [Leminorella richardii]
MNKWLIGLMAAGALTFGAAVNASDVEAPMKSLAKNYRAVLNADSAEAFKEGLAAMKQAAQEAKQGTPTKLEGKASDSAEVTDYHHGIDVLIGEIDGAQALVDEGKLDEAKKAAEQFKVTRDEYHKKYK